MPDTSDEPELTAPGTLHPAMTNAAARTITVAFNVFFFISYLA